MALGWLIGDAVGAPLLSRVLAHAVGLKARRIAGAVKADIASIRKDAACNASKLAEEDPQRKKVAAQAKAAEAELLQAAVPMPDPGPDEQAQALGARKAGAARAHHCPRCLAKKSAVFRPFLDVGTEYGSDLGRFGSLQECSWYVVYAV